MSELTSILIVDDEPAVATTLADILETKGFKVYAAFSGAEALEIMGAHLIDILLTDVRMPDMNGVTLYRLARKKYPQVVTYLMTAYAADDLIQQGMKEGIKTVLTKPLDIDLLIALFTAYQSLFTKGRGQADEKAP
jgi:Response regulator containing CheY-like receiver, AAA-type ATPase, and DNA-binding domains